MIITCPACATRYEVPESSIGSEGRTVRCANCRHSWLQELPPELAKDERPDENPLVLAEPEALAGPVPDAAASAPAMTAPQMPSAGYAPAAPSASAFEYEPPFAPRRGGARMWLLALVVFILFAVGIAAAAFAWYGVPDWIPMSRQSLARVTPGLVLDFPNERMDRRTLANGTAYFGASGTVTNVGAVRRVVPPIEIVLRDRRRQVVYRWDVIPPRRQLGPGESMTINEAVTDIPRSAIASEIGWKAS